MFWRNPKSWWKTNHAVIGSHPDLKLKLSQTQPSLPKPAEIRRGQLIPSRLQTRTMDRGYCSRFIVRFGYMSGGGGAYKGQALARSTLVLELAEAVVLGFASLICLSVNIIAALLLRWSCNLPLHQEILWDNMIDIKYCFYIIIYYYWYFMKHGKTYLPPHS